MCRKPNTKSATVSENMEISEGDDMGKDENKNGEDHHGLNAEVVGAAPATSTAQLYISGAQALALSYANNVNQQNLNHLVGSILTVQNALAIQNIGKDASSTEMSEIISLVKPLINAEA